LILCFHIKVLINTTAPSEEEIENLFFCFFRTQGEAGFAYRDS